MNAWIVMKKVDRRRTEGRDANSTNERNGLLISNATDEPNAVCGRGSPGLSHG